MHTTHFCALSEPTCKKKELSGQEETSNDAALASDSSSQDKEVDSTANDKVEGKANTKNGSDVSSNGASVGENGDVCTEEEVVIKVKKDDIIAQV